MDALKDRIARSITDKWHNYWHQKTPLRKAQFIHRMADMAAKSVTMTCFSSDENSLLSYIPYAGFVVYLLGLAYTIGINLQSGQFEKACFPLCTFGSLILVYLKYAIFYTLSEPE